jgi:copper(I)-binding protein
MIGRLAFAALLLSAPLAVAQETQVGQLTFVDAHIAVPSAAAKVGGGYVVIRNQGDAVERLLGGAADFAGSVEVHETTVDEYGVARMSAVEALEIPPGGAVSLEPGGYHIMFMGLTGPLPDAEPVTVTLRFETAGDVAVPFTVKPAGGHDH